MTNLEKDVIDKRLVNSVKYLYLSSRLVWSLFTCKKVLKQMWKQAQGTKKSCRSCTTDLTSYSPTQWQFWQLTLKWISGACAQDKNNQYYSCFLFFFWFLFNYAIQGKPITWLENSTLNRTWNRYRTNREGFRVQFNVEFRRQVMNFPIVLRKSRTRSRSRRRI